MILDLLQTLWAWGGLPVGAALVFMLDASKREAEMARQVWAGVVVAGIAACLSWFVADA